MSDLSFVSSLQLSAVLSVGLQLNIKKLIGRPESAGRLVKCGSSRMENFWIVGKILCGNTPKYYT